MFPTIKQYQILFFLLGLVFLYLAREGFTTGQVRIKGEYKGKPVALREESPFVYWFTVVLYFLLGIFSLGFSIFIQFKTH